jgi:broad specificity phosphatase PhoE
MTGFRTLTLYVVRHGECEHNVEGWAASHDDSPLTENGRRQARANARMLRDVAGRVDNLDFFASSLHRTCNTMELLREEIGLPPTGYRADRRLMEGNLGDHTRMPGSALAMGHPEEYRADPWNYVRPNGESQAMVYERVGRFLATLRRDSVIVTHALPVIALRAHYLGLSPEQAMGYHMANAGVMRLSQGTEALFGK